MDVYYYFHNLTRNERNIKPLSSNGFDFIANLDTSPESLIKEFKNVIQVNNWEENEEICVYPDSGEYYYINYKSGKLYEFDEVNDKVVPYGTIDSNVIRSKKAFGLRKHSQIKCHSV